MTRFPEDGSEHRRPLWADEHREALQELVDPTIQLVGGDNAAYRGWGLPAGWVPIVNRLHGDLVDLLGDYEVVRVGNKMSGLRYAIDRSGDASPEVHRAVDELLQVSRAESLSACDLCGGPAHGTLSFGITRCTAHKLTRERRWPGALARPPGWHPGGADA